MLFAYSCGSDWIDDNKLLGRLRAQRWTLKVLHGFRHGHFSLVDLIYGPHHTLEEHEGMFQPVTTTMARSNPVSKSTISSRSGSGSRLPLFWSSNGAPYLQAASCLALQFLPTRSAARVSKMDPRASSSQGDVISFWRTTSTYCDCASPSPFLSDGDLLQPLLPCSFVHQPMRPDQLLLRDAVIRGQYYMMESLGHTFMRE